MQGNKLPASRQPPAETGERTRGPRPARPEATPIWGCPGPPPPARGPGWELPGESGVLVCLANYCGRGVGEGLVGTGIRSFKGKDAVN